MRAGQLLYTALLLMTFVVPARTSAAAPPAQSAMASTPNEADWRSRLEDMDRRVAEIKDLSAHFQQQKHTAMLKKPLESSGRLLILGDRSRWNTERPHSGVMTIGGGEIRIYHPQSATLEIFRVDQQLQWLALSPLPRLQVLRAHFSMAQVPAAELDPAFSGPEFLAVRLTPMEESLRAHVSRIDVFLDTRVGWVVRSETLDLDGDRTILAFSDIVINSGISRRDVELEVPDSTKVVRPLEAFEKDTSRPAVPVK